MDEVEKVETITIEIGEWINSVTTNQDGTFIEMDKDLVREVIELLEGVCCANAK